MLGFSYLCSVALLAMVNASLGEFEFNSMPVMSPAVIASPKKGYGLFFNLWKYSLKVDNKERGLPAIRINLEPKSMFIPEDASMANLIPQDASHPLYLKGEKYSKLRREFLLDHLMLDTVEMDECPLSSHGPSQGLTLSGKTILIRKDKRGNLIAGGVAVLRSLTLTDGAKVFLLKKPLFNLTEKVREVFNHLHEIHTDDLLGPPLDIDAAISPPLSYTVIRAPAPPSLEAVNPPSAPSNLEIENDTPEIEESHPPPVLSLADIQSVQPPALLRSPIIEDHASAPQNKISPRLHGTAPVPRLVQI